MQLESAARIIRLMLHSEYFRRSQREKLERRECVGRTNAYRVRIVSSIPGIKGKESAVPDENRALR